MYFLFIIELVSRTAPEKLYNGLIGAYHYLGYGQGTGEQLKYVIALETRALGAIGFSAAAWRVACRDHFLGWNDQARQKNLNLLVNNHRFLILPWIKIANLALSILAQVARRLRQDWQTLYAHDIVLAETFVEKKRIISHQKEICHERTAPSGAGRRIMERNAPRHYSS